FVCCVLFVVVCLFLLFFFLFFFFFFFFQAEDGIRDLTVTGVQTCALPISRLSTNSGVRAWRTLRVYAGCAAFRNGWTCLRWVVPPCCLRAARNCIARNRTMATLEIRARTGCHPGFCTSAMISNGT